MDQLLFSKIDAATDELASLSKELQAEFDKAKSITDHVEVITFFNAVSEMHDRFVAAKKLYDAIYDGLSREVVPDVMRANKIKSIRLEGIGQVVISHRFSCTMIDKEKGIEFLKSDPGTAPLVQETVNSQTLSAFAKRLIEDEGKELPEEIFKVGTSPYTSIRK